MANVALVQGVVTCIFCGAESTRSDDRIFVCAALGTRDAVCSQCVSICNDVLDDRAARDAAAEQEYASWRPPT